MNKALVFLFVVLSLKLTHQKLEETLCADVKEPSGYSDCDGKSTSNASGKCCFVKAKSENSSVNKCAVFFSENAGDMVSYLRKEENYSGVDCGKGLVEIDRSKTYCSEKIDDSSNSFDAELCFNSDRFYGDSKCFLATKKASENSTPSKVCVEASTKSEAKVWADEKYETNYEISLFEYCEDKTDPEEQSDCAATKIKDPAKKKCCIAQYYPEGRSTGKKAKRCHAFKNENAYYVLEELKGKYKVSSTISEIDYFDCGNGKVNVYNGLEKTHCSDRETDDDDKITKYTCSSSYKLYTNTQCCYAKVVESNSSLKSVRCVEAKDKADVEDFLKILYGQTSLNATVECGSSYVYLGYLSLLLLLLF